MMIKKDIERPLKPIDKEIGKSFPLRKNLKNHTKDSSQHSSVTINAEHQIQKQSANSKRMNQDFGSTGKEGMMSLRVRVARGRRNG